MELWSATACRRFGTGVAALERPVQRATVRYNKATAGRRTPKHSKVKISVVREERYRSGLRHFSAIPQLVRRLVFFVHDPSDTEGSAT